MAEFFSSITDRGAAPGLVKTMAYQEARLRAIAENVANHGTPGYRALQLDEGSFRLALREAFVRRKESPAEPFVVQAGNEVQTDPTGKLRVTPGRVPPENVLFHDGTNASIERQMAALADAGMKHEMAAELLRGRMDGLRRAIRGRLG